MKLNPRSLLILLSFPLFAVAIAGGALQLPNAQAASPAAELCMKISRSRIVTPTQLSSCQEKISNSTFDAQAVGVCSAMIDLRLSTVTQVYSCIDAIRDKTYPNGTDVCLMMFNSLATTSAITGCLEKSGRLIPAYSSSGTSGTVASDEIDNEKSINRAISKIDAAIFQLDSDGANASTVYAIEQLQIAKNELMKLKLRLSSQKK